MRVAALCLLLVSALSCQAADTGDAAPALISVSGTGTVTAVPDQATITVGVTSQGKDAATAVAANNQAMAALNDALGSFNIAERDRRSRGFTVQPRYDHRRNTDGMPDIAGYTVSNQVTVRVRDLDSLGDLLGAIVDSGGNTINSMQFGNTKVDELLDEARELAVKHARHKAELYAGAAGGSVGPVVSISEAGASLPRPQARSDIAYMSQRSESFSVPISAGENEFKAVVNVVYELEQ